MSASYTEFWPLLVGLDESDNGPIGNRRALHQRTGVRPFAPQIMFLSGPAKCMRRGYRDSAELLVYHAIDRKLRY